MSATDAYRSGCTCGSGQELAVAVRERDRLKHELAAAQPGRRARAVYGSCAALLGPAGAVVATLGVLATWRERFASGLTLIALGMVLLTGAAFFVVGAMVADH